MKEKSTLGKIKDCILEHRVIASFVVGSVLCYPILKYYHNLNQSQSDWSIMERLRFAIDNFETHAGVAWQALKNYFIPYLALDLINYWFHSQNIDRPYNFFGLAKKKRYLEKCIEINREPTYYLQLALLDYKDGNEKKCIRHLNESFELREPIRDADDISLTAFIMAKLNRFIFKREHFLSNFLVQCAEIGRKEQKSDLEKIISAAGFALNGYETAAKDLLDEVENKEESIILLKSQIYGRCFREYQHLAGRELEKIVDESRLIPFSDRPRNRLFILDVEDESLKNQILVKTNKDRGEIEKEYDLTSLFHNLLGDLIPRPFGLVGKNYKKYLLMKNVEGKSYQKHFKANGVEIEELEKIVSAIAKYQHLAELFEDSKYKSYVKKYNLMFDFIEWFNEKVISRLGQAGDSEILEAAGRVNDFVKIYMKYTVGMHGDFTIDNLLRRKTGPVTIIDSERFKLGLGLFDLFNIMEDTRLDLDEDQKKYLFQRYVGKQFLRSPSFWSIFSKKDKFKELLEKQYNTLFYPKQMATAVMFYDYLKMTGKNEFEEKIRHHINRMKTDRKPAHSAVLDFRDVALGHLLKSPLKEYVL